MWRFFIKMNIIINGFHEKSFNEIILRIINDFSEGYCDIILSDNKFDLPDRVP